MNRVTTSVQCLTDRRIYDAKGYVQAAWPNGTVSALGIDQLIRMNRAADKRCWSSSIQVPQSSSLIDLLNNATSRFNDHLTDNTRVHDTRVWFLLLATGSAEEWNKRRTPVIRVCSNTSCFRVRYDMIIIGITSRKLMQIVCYSWLFNQRWL